jgi:dienelactone hydrolase
MGVTMQWREPPDRENRSFGKIVHFGGGRDAGSGYMALSDRVGPGVLLVHEDGTVPWLRPSADRLNKRGFTVLAPQIHKAREGLSDRSAQVLEAAADFLMDNWHPELGVIVYGAPDERVHDLLSGAKPSGVVAYDDLPGVEPSCPLLLHLPASSAPPDLEVLRPDTETHIYPDVQRGFAEPGSRSFDAASAELAEERSVDFLSYYLS